VLVGEKPGNALDSRVARHRNSPAAVSVSG